MASKPTESDCGSPAASDKDPSGKSAVETMDPEKMMEWEEWERWMAKLQSRGLKYFLKRYVATRRIDIDKFLVNLDVTIVQANEIFTDEPEEITKIQALIKLERSIIKFLNVRKKLPEYNTIDDAVSLIQRSNKILILTGAGISTSCGIPDFRSENGLYSQLQDYDGLDDAYDMFDLQFFKSNPKPFYKFLRTIFPFSSTISNGPSSSSLLSESKSINPSDSHRFVKLLESKSKLLRNYSSVNIDTLEMRAGVQNLIQCHGSFAKFTCLKCKTKYPGSQFEDLISQAKVVLCPTCSTCSDCSSSFTECQPNSKKRRKTHSDGQYSVALDGLNDNDDDDDDGQAGIDWVSLGLMKPDITFFGEDLPSEFDEAIEVDRFECDLVIVIGTSLKVAPVSEIIKFVPSQVPQILINRDPIYHGGEKNSGSREQQQVQMFEYDGDEFEFDIYLLGDSDLILRELSDRLGPKWQLPIPITPVPSQSENLDESVGQKTNGSMEKIHFNQYHSAINHIWLFSGSNSSHPWFYQWQKAADEEPINSDSDPENVQPNVSSSSKDLTN